MEYFNLNDGSKVPAIGFGTYKIVEEKEMDLAINEALEAGYRYFDTAKYYKNEKILGRYLKESGVKDYQLATKIWPNAYGKDKTRRSLDESLEDLAVDYLDFALLHWYGQGYKDALEVLKDYQDQGIIGSIGVCNFSIKQMRELLETGIRPALDQLESHLHLHDDDTHRFLEENNILHQAWGSLAQGKSNLLEEEVLRKIADKYGKSPAQVALRWNIDRNVMVLVKSANKDRIRENIDIFDFKLDKEDMYALASLDKKIRYSNDPEDEDWLKKASKM